jgi:hypothetical protein
MKKIKETKLGEWLKKKSPKILDAVGDVLPSSGILGIIKNLISQGELPAEDVLEFEKMIRDYEIEIAKLEVSDRASARIRETEYIKATGHADWMMIAVGILILLAFIACLGYVVYKPIPQGNEHIVINAIGILEGLVLSVAGYYYGSSIGSRIKDLR